jgi:hypothetical protein
MYELRVNLFHINKAVKNGFKLSNEGVSIRLEKVSMNLTLKPLTMLR